MRMFRVFLFLTLLIFSGLVVLPEASALDYSKLFYYFKFDQVPLKNEYISELGGIASSSVVETSVVDFTFIKNYTGDVISGTQSLVAGGGKIGDSVSFTGTTGGVFNNLGNRRIDETYGSGQLTLPFEDSRGNGVTHNVWLKSTDTAGSIFDTRLRDPYTPFAFKDGVSLLTFTGSGGNRYEGQGTGIDSGIPFLNDNAWHMWTTVFKSDNNSRVLFYKDGVLVANKTTCCIDGTLSAIYRHDYLMIGNTEQLISSNTYTGQMDEMSYWVKELNQTEINQLYNSGSGLALSTATNVPTLVTGLRGTYYGFEHENYLEWNQTSYTAQYEINRNGTLIDTIDAKDNFYLDDTIAENTTYSYTVEAISPNGNGGESDPVIIETTESPFDNTELKWYWNSQNGGGNNVFCDNSANTNGIVIKHGGANTDLWLGEGGYDYNEGEGQCQFFKTFDKSDVTGSSIELFGSTTSAPSSGSRLRLQVYDGAYDPTKGGTDFDFTGTFPTINSKGAGSLGALQRNLGGNNLNNENFTLHNYNINWAGSTLPQVTVVVTLWQFSPRFPSVEIETMQIGNFALFNFSESNLYSALPLDEYRRWNFGWAVANGTEQVTVTQTPPDEITSLIGNTQTDTCQLSWDAPFDGDSPIINYQIYRSVNNSPYSFLINKTVTSHDDTGLTNNILYKYNVTATNAIGTSGSSNIVDCMPVVETAPTEPISLDAEEELDGDIGLTWSLPEEGDPSGYRIERKVEGGSFVIIFNDTESTDLFYQNDPADPAIEYTYRVAGWNNFGLGEYSNEALITTGGLPNAPVLTAFQDGDMIVLEWTEPASESSILGYKIDRRINFGTLTTYIADTGSTSLTFEDDNVVKPNTYGYRVRAISSSGEGIVSNIVDVAFGSHVIVQVREQDGSGFKGGGVVRASNSTYSNEVALNSNSNSIFDNLDGNFNYTFIDNSDFILNKTFNFPFPTGNSTTSFTINALVFDVDCPANGAGTDLRIKVNYTNAKDIFSFPSTPVCDSTDQVSWSTRWVGGAVSDSSVMVADFISSFFKANALQFLASNALVLTSYSSSTNAITSNPFTVDPTDDTINFNLFMARAPAGGGGGGSGTSTGVTTPQTAIPTPEIVFAGRLTGLSMLSKTHPFAQAGDIIRGSITVNWEGETNLIVKNYKVGEFDGTLTFDEMLPFPLDQKTEGIGEFAMSTAEVFYTIVLSPQKCDDEIGITQNCFHPILHTIPIEFTFGLGDQEYQASTEVFVDGRPIPIDVVQLQIILLFLVLIASAIFGNIIRKRLQRKQTVKRKFRKRFDSS